MSDGDYLKPNQYNTILQGWQCPSCHKIYSPANTECFKCNYGLAPRPTEVEITITKPTLTGISYKNNIV
jgi:uncharacterized OB-fold protein|tara:strand:- start:255 stop:461 length:207 start_codon:yes stop_codon:yes gene_type:complete